MVVSSCTVSPERCIWVLFLLFRAKSLWAEWRPWVSGGQTGLWWRGRQGVVVFKALQHFCFQGRPVFVRTAKQL